MLNKYPEIWLRESVKLVDLQTSSIFCLPPHPPPHAFLLWPSVTRLQKAHGTKEGRRPETLKPITIDQCALTGGGKKNSAYLHTHANLSGYGKPGMVSDGYCLIAHSEQTNCQYAKLLLPAIFHHPQKA